MKKEILNRYSRTPDNRIIIDITATKVADLYNDFDRHAPYRKKELDQDLVDYIIDSAEEIGNKDFVLQFRLSTPPDASLIVRVQTSIHNYFRYLIALEFREMAKMSRSSVILFAIGVVILFGCVWINKHIADQDTVVGHVFAEGLNVAAWVSLWNAIATFLISWAPRRHLIKMYRKISSAEILFSQH